MLFSPSIGSISIVPSMSAEAIWLPSGDQATASAAVLVMMGVPVYCAGGPEKYGLPVLVARASFDKLLIV